MNTNSARQTGRYCGLAAVAIAVGFLPAGTARSAGAGNQAKCDDFVAKSLKGSTQKIGGWTSVIVRSDGAMTADREKAIASLGGDIYRHLDLIESVAVRVPTRSLSKLVALTFVKRVSLDAAISKNDEFTDGHTGANAAWAAVSSGGFGVSGNGVTVAVVDSGIRARHRDLALIPATDLDTNDQDYTEDGNNYQSRVIATKDFTGSNGHDDCGHGTHVAGIIAGNGYWSSMSNAKRTFYGVAPRANIISAKVLDGSGQGTVSGVIAGISWVVSHKAQYNVRVLNLSLGHPIGESYTTDPLCQSVEAAYRAGIVVVTAAGNGGRLNAAPVAGAANEGYGKNVGSIQSPANDPFVITVGAMKNINGTRASDRIATYSSRGPSRIDQVLKPDLVAPGNAVISLNAVGSSLHNAYLTTNGVPQTYYLNTTVSRDSSKYFVLSGTSMASPVVAGAVALMLEKNPTLTPDTVKARLMISADKWANANGTWDACTYGAGYLNIMAALGSSASATHAATSPALVRDLAGHVVVDPSQVIWGNVGGQQVIWGVNGVQNTQVIWGNAIVQSNQILWGNQTVSATQVLWGNIVADPTDLLTTDITIWDTAPPVDRVIWGNNAGVDLTSTALTGE